MKNGATWRFTDHVVPQNTLHGYLLRMTVIGPDGSTLARVDDSQPWFVQGNQAFLQVGVDAPQVLELEVTPG